MGEREGEQEERDSRNRDCDGRKEESREMEDREEGDTGAKEASGTRNLEERRHEQEQRGGEAAGRRSGETDGKENLAEAGPQRMRDCTATADSLPRESSWACRARRR